MKKQGNGSAAWAATNQVSATVEGSLVWDDANDAIAYCDGTNWITLGDSTSIQSGFNNAETLGQSCTTPGTLSHSASGELMVCADFDGVTCSGFNPGALSIGSDGSVFLCTN
ncbi:hypothetical protein [Pseudophaeobacter sp. A-200-2]|uniref:hypothetical protein n=1 Tax=Pseudophaeobacter sp. A-200-2 TaxID=3098145 RepID=UPI0034D647DC